MIRIFTNLRAILSSILLAINDGGAVEASGRLTDGSYFSIISGPLIWQKEQ
jgi:hypothetical protein